SFPTLRPTPRTTRFPYTTLFRSTTEQIIAREIVVYGKVNGDLRARDRIEIKKDGSVTGDLVTARIIIEDGAYFKGHIEIDRSNTQVGTDLDSLFSRTISKSD